ncbi:MAG: hypothetical protein J6U40_06100, partial [Kiritimatiellae bacterium]|nr:hypothetical protein [Kiritimatiellia bacterium]
EYEYDPFGKVVSHTGRDFDFQFSTKFYDPDIDMYYYGYRYYSPELRRWASPDPAWEEMFDMEPNPYAFIRNDPVAKIDFLGLWLVEAVLGQIRQKNGMIYHLRRKDKRTCYCTYRTLFKNAFTVTNLPVRTVSYLTATGEIIPKGAVDASPRKSGLQ